MLTQRTLRPGLLVSLKTSLVGNVNYLRRVLDERIDERGAHHKKSETERTIENAAEHEAGKKAQNKASSLVRGVCAKSDFGLLCPEAKRDDLEAAIAKARKVADDFNNGAELSHLRVNVIIGRVAADDVEALKSINSEVTDLLNKMEGGLRNFDVKAIRAAANEARDLGSMLTPESGARIQKAIAAVRSTARQIVKAGETAANELDLNALRSITEARTEFLDLGEMADIGEVEQESRAVDLAPMEVH